MHVGKALMPKCVQYEGSMAICMGKGDRLQEKYKKFCYLTDIGPHDLIFNKPIPVANIHIVLVSIMAHTGIQLT